LHEKLDHIKDTNDNLKKKYWECKMKDREDEKEKKTCQKEPLAAESTVNTYSPSTCIYLFFLF
jgi:hypothetical protein